MAKPSAKDLEVFVPGELTAEGERICCSVIEGDPELQCNICQYVMVNPIFLGCCAHHLCEGCLENIQQSKMQGKKRCPFCQQDFTTLLNQHLQKKVHQVKVRCPNNSKGLGCSWTGKLNEVMRHILPQAKEDGCLFQVVRCKYPECRTKILRKDLRKHESEVCQFRMYTCKFCLDVTDTYQKVTEVHFLVCPDYTVPCPNKCNSDYMLRSAVTEHLNTCPYEEVMCDLVLAGCNMRCPRKDMQAHCKTASHYHNKLLLNQNAALQVKVADNEGQILRVIKQQEEQNSRVGELLRQQDLKHQQQLAILEVKIAEITGKTDGHHRAVTATMSGDARKDFTEKVTRLEKKFAAESDQVRNELTGVISQVFQLKDSQEETGKKVADNTSVVSSVQRNLEYVEKCITPRPPFAFTVSRFSEHKFNKEPFVSKSFYTHPRGYKVCVRVDLHGMNNNMAVHCCIMKGEHDEALRWPFRGDIHIQIQNQLGDHHHYLKVIKYDDTTGGNKSGRVLTGDMNYCNGLNQFISHQGLGLDQANNCQYLKGDAVDFEVVKVDIRS